MSIAIDVSVQFTWAIANTEAFLAGDSRIRPIHFLLGILKVIDPAFTEQVSGLDLPEEHLVRLKRTAQAARHYLEMSPDDITNFRRRLRRTVRAKGQASSGHGQIPVLHRSDQSRAIFAALGNRTTQTRQREITALSLLEEFVRSEVVDLEALWQLVVKGKETTTGAAPRKWSTGREWQIVDEADEQPAVAPDLPPVLDGHGRNLTQLARQGHLWPVLGRKSEIAAVARFLHRASKRSVLLIGAPGIGKTSIVEALAQKLCRPKAPAALSDATLIQITAGELLLALTAGGRDSGQIRARLDALASLSGLILGIEDIDRLLKPEPRHEAAAELLRNAIVRGELTVLGTATDRGYDTMQTAHDSFTGALNALHVEPVSASECIAIAQQWSEAIARFHGVQFAQGAIDRAVEIASRNIPNGVLPATVIDLLENAAVYCKVAAFSSHPTVSKQRGSTVTEQIIHEVMREQYGVDLNM